MPTRQEFKGPKASIELHEFEDGECPAHEFLASLSQIERQKVDALFCLMGEMGQIRNKEHFKKLEGSDGIWEFKKHQIRLLCFYARGASPARLIITHGVMKKSDKHAKSDIGRAESIKKMYDGDQR